MAWQLVRYVTRTSDRMPHQIRPNILKLFSDIKLARGALIPRSAKNLYWNIDHLLNRTEVEIISLICVRMEEPSGAKIDKRLELKVDTNAIEKGLGASEIKGNTHFLHLIDSSKNGPLLINSLV